MFVQRFQGEALIFEAAHTCMGLGAMYPEIMYIPYCHNGRRNEGRKLLNNADGIGLRRMGDRHVGPDCPSRWLAARSGPGCSITLRCAVIPPWHECIQLKR